MLFKLHEIPWTGPITRRFAIQRKENMWWKGLINGSNGKQECTIAPISPPNSNPSGSPVRHLPHWMPCSYKNGASRCFTDTWSTSALKTLGFTRRLGSSIFCSPFTYSHWSSRCMYSHWLSWLSISSPGRAMCSPFNILFQCWIVTFLLWIKMISLDSTAETFQAY